MTHTTDADIHAAFQAGRTYRLNGGRPEHAPAQGTFSETYAFGLGARGVKRVTYEGGIVIAHAS